MSSYLDSASGLANGLASIAKNITLGKFIRWTFTLLVIGAIVLYAFDRYSSTFFYNKLDRKIAVLEKIQRLGATDTLIQKETQKKLLEILNSIDQPSNSSTILPQSVWVALAKVLGAIIFPLLAILFSLKAPDRKSIIAGGLVLIVVFGTISIFIPIIHSLWINFFLFPVVEILILIPFIPRK